eukprot:TRINITY_DN24838_c0_g1_i1.p2 TRINITY_DN24838_c0_g1~~TRINITY_DN24838_c0_g1_i1.p2  ORF type:complete len:188 (+),score=80.03 TRINITY_DN24838_c0_g1_i1:66-629(+)
MTATVSAIDLPLRELKKAAASALSPEEKAALKAKAVQRKDALQAERDALRNENEVLKQELEAAKQRAEGRLMKQRAENVTMEADNVELKKLVEEVRVLREQKKAAKAALREGRDPKELGIEYEVVCQKKEASKMAMMELLPRPVRTAPGDGMDSPRAETPTSVSPRIEMAQTLAQSMRSGSGGNPSS